MFLKFDLILMNPQNHLSLKNLMFPMYHLYLMFDSILMNLQNHLNHLNLKYLMYHLYLMNLKYR